METRCWLRRLLRYLAISPYGWRYTLRLPYYYCRPSARNRIKMPKPPLQAQCSIAKGAVTRFVFAGDMMPLAGHRIPTLSTELIQLIRQADYFIANCEPPVIDALANTHYRSFLTFTMPINFLTQILVQIGIDSGNCIFSVANNHSRDILAQDFDKGVQLLRERLGVHVVGDFQQKQAFEVFHSQQGLHFAVSAWTELMNGEQALDKREVVFRGHHIRRQDWQITKKQQGIDCLIGLPHWGREYQHFPDKQTYQDAQQFAKQGFDVLIGGHSHLLQPLTRFDQTLCNFSLGNLFSVDWHWRTKVLPLLAVDIAPDGSIVQYQYHFFMQVKQGQEVVLLPISQVTPLQKRRVAKLLKQCFH